MFHTYRLFHGLAEHISMIRACHIKTQLICMSHMLSFTRQAAWKTRHSFYNSTQVRIQRHTEVAFSFKKSAVLMAAPLPPPSPFTFSLHTFILELELGLEIRVDQQPEGVIYSCHKPRDCCIYSCGHLVVCVCTMATACSSS